MLNTFPRGVHPDSNKLTDEVAIAELPAPQKVYVPLKQHSGAPAKAIVKAGDTVKAGTLIGQADGKISANVFSPVSGVVEAIEKRPTPSNGLVEHIVIKNDFKDEFVNFEPLKNATSEQIIKRIEECGIVGLGGAGFPTAVKLTPPAEDDVDTLLINAAECEPYVTADHRIMLEYGKEMLFGVMLLAKALNVSKIYIGVESNKLDAVQNLNSLIENNPEFSNIIVTPLKVKYPQGAEKQLIYAVTGKKVPAGCLPSKAGVIVQNAHTALAVYYAVAEGQPLYKRIVTFSGRAAKKPGNYWVRTGTLYEDLIKELGFAVTQEEIEAAQKEVDGLSDSLKSASKEKAKEIKARLKEAAAKLKELKSKECVKLLNGGPMMGDAVADLNVAITKTTSCVLALTQGEVNMMQSSQCINCAKCARVCPMFLMPMYIDSSTLNKDYESAKKYGAMHCIECGCCAYICPAKRELVRTIRLAKKIIRERGL